MNLYLTMVSMLNIIAIAAILSVLSLPVSSVEGGNRTSVEKYPFLAQLSVQKPNGKTGRCSASIVAPQFIISAYHCIHKSEFDESYAVNNTLVITGTSNAYQKGSNDGVVHKVERFYHKENVPIGNFTGSNDILVIKLSEPIEYNAVQQPIKLTGDESLQIGDAAWFAGIGLPAGQTSFDYFREGETKIIDVLMDNYIYDNSEVYGRGGDSGGPFFSKLNDEWILHGIVPSGGHYSPRMASFCDWIKEVTNNELPC